ncbi:MAG: aminoacyl-tRNA hydrolase [Acidimicrobiales bacterium]
MSDYLVVGLGNPGAEYARTRHNVGAETVELLAARHGGRLRRGKEQALVDEVTIAAKRVALAFPQTYMNRSGDSVGLLVRRYHVSGPAQVVVVHDELDLPTGRVKVKEGGGLAGHNGLRSIKEHLHSDAFLRIRIGVGRPPNSQAGADYVLRRPGKAERVELDVAVQEAADALEHLVAHGVADAMNRYNRSPE